MVDEKSPEQADDWEQRLEECLAHCPQKPGVYLMKGENREILYIGKAKSLRPRVRSYFRAQAEHSAKTKVLLSHVRDLEFIQTSSEVEALLLENNLIKKWKPRYNIRLKDDKNYPFIKIDGTHDFPRPYLSRKWKKEEKVDFFGPYPDAYAMRRTMALSSKVFMLRDCKDVEFSNRARPCLSYQIGQCTAPCVGKVSKEDYAGQVQEFREFLKGERSDLAERWKEEMKTASEELNFERAAQLRDRLKAIENILGQEQRMVDTSDGRDKDVWCFWPDTMESVGSHMAFLILQYRQSAWVGRVFREISIEDSLVEEGFQSQLMLQYYGKYELPELVLIPRPIQSIKLEELAQALREKASTEEAPDLVCSDEKKEWASLMEMAFENLSNWVADRNLYRQEKDEGMMALQKMLKLKTPPRHMECIDVSHFQGEANVASCVVFKDGKPEKTLYRHYKIKSVQGADDFQSIREVVQRRFSKESPVIPDLLVIDGGRGQLAAASEILDELELDFPLVGLAKARSQSDFQSEEVTRSDERVFLRGRKNPKKISDPLAFRLLTQIRDEAHRFAITFHRKKRGGQG